MIGIRVVLGRDVTSFCVSLLVEGKITRRCPGAKNVIRIRVVLGRDVTSFGVSLLVEGKITRQRPSEQ